MAEKKEKKVTEEVKEEVTEVKETKKKKHTVYFPPSEFEGDDFVVFGINGNVTAIKRGYDVEVDDDLYESIVNCRKDDKVAFDRLREHKKELEQMAKL